jgi:hypothetical protein
MKAAVVAALPMLALPGAAAAQGIGCTGLTGLDLTACVQQQLENSTALSRTLVNSTARVSTSSLGAGTSTFTLGTSTSSLGTSASRLGTNTIATGSGSLQGSQASQNALSRQSTSTSSFRLVPTPSLGSSTAPLTFPLSTSATTGSGLNSSTRGFASSRTASSSASSTSDGLSTFDTAGRTGGTIGRSSTATGMGSNDLDPFDDDLFD